MILNVMKNIPVYVILIVLIVLPIAIRAEVTATPSPTPIDDSDARPPVTPAELKIVKRAGEILDSPAKWNRADNRECPSGAKTFSLYCALQVATNELTGRSEHRGAALQEARFVIDEIALNRNYDHRLMDYNNDPSTTFEDIQEVLRIVNSLITMRLKAEGSGATPSKVEEAAAPAAVTKNDIEIAKRVRQILDSPSKWNRDNTQECPVDAKTFNLYCALLRATTEINGRFDEAGVTMREAKRVIDETAPNAKTYKARLVDYNRDPTTTFADIQALLRLVESRLAKRMAEGGIKP